MKKSDGERRRIWWAVAIGSLLFLVTYPQSAGAQTNTFPPSGNVGIGTLSPTSPVSIAGNEPSNDYATLRVKPTVTHGGIVIDSANNTSQVHLRFYKNGVPKWQFRVPFQDGTEDFRLYSWAANADVLTVNPAGNVGIGTINPAARFDVRQLSSSLATLLLSYGVNEDTYLRGGTSAAVVHIGDLNTSKLLLMESSGNVGIGTASPLTKLQVAGGTRVDGTNGRVYIGTGAVQNYRGLEIIEENATTFSIRHHDPNVAWQNIAINPYGGNVGIGTLAPSTKLHVVGDINATGTGNINASGTITGGNIVAKYQDVAEWVESSQALPAGTVVVLDQTKSNQVVASSNAYDTRVAGVISAQPGITLGEKGESKVLVATTGRVKMKVAASRAPIHIGDLLVTSDIPGVAMKSEPVKVGGRLMHMPGTLIGKALEPLEKGSGQILVLLSLQ